MFPVGNSADATRELFVRRLAAGDKNMDIINMDTIYTPEFAEAGWMTRDDRRQQGGRARRRPRRARPQSVTWKDKVYGIPTNTNVQLLWYRKDLVPKPPETWDEMIEMAKKLPPGKGNILEQGQKYEGYVVWFNNLVASAGGKIVNAEGEPVLNEAAVKAAEIIKDVATSGRADPSLSTAQEDPVAARLRGRQGRLPAQLAVRVRRRARGRGRPARVTKKVFENMGYARWPGVNKGEPSKVSIGGANLGVPKYGQEPRARDRRPRCA